MKRLRHLGIVFTIACPIFSIGQHPVPGANANLPLPDLARLKLAAEDGDARAQYEYLNEAELGFTLGIFCVRGNIDPELALKHLKQNPAEVF